MRKQSNFFGKRLESEYKRIAWIQNFPVFNRKSNSEADEAPYWTPFNLLPDATRYNEAIAQVYQNKIICYLCANKDYKTYKKLYERTPISEVWEFFALTKACNE